MMRPARPIASAAAAYTFDDLVKALGPSVMQRAVDVQHTNPPRRIERSADRTRISAVTPSQSHHGVYQQTIILTRLGAALRVKGYCTCPLGQNCKHVGAVLLQAMTDDEPVADQDQMRHPPDLLDVAPPHLPLTLPSLPSPPASRQGDARSPPILSTAARQWLERLHQIGVGKQEQPSSQPPTRQLFYRLARSQQDPGAGLWSLHPLSVGIARDGTFRYNDVRPVDPDHADRLAAQGIKYLTDDDVALLRDLSWLRRQAKNAREAQLKPGIASTELLQRILATGRLRLGLIDSRDLVAGETVRADVAWQSAADGSQTLTFRPADQRGEFDAVIALTPPHYVRDGRLGPIDSGLPDALAVEMARAPAIGLTEASLVRAELARRTAAAGGAASDLVDHATGEITVPAPIIAAIPLPAAPDEIVTERIAPHINLRLFMGDVRLKQRYATQAPDALRFQAFRMPLAQLSFDYDGDIARPGDGRHVIERIDGARLLRRPRDYEKEEAAAMRLKSARLIPVAQAVFDVQGLPDGVFWVRPRADADAFEMLSELDQPERFIAFSSDEVPKLQRAGWHVTFDDDYPYRIATGATDWWAEIDDGGRIDWFSFEIGITFEGKRLNIIPQLAALLARLPPSVAALAAKPGADAEFARELARIDLFAHLEDGRLLKLPADRLATILRGLFELIGPRADRIGDGMIKVHRAESASLAGFADRTSVAWAASGDRLLELGRALQRGRALADVLPPPSFKATLRPYQSEGLAWLDFLREAGFGGVLADDMGLGKTVQMLALLSREKHAGRLTLPALIVAPTSVLPNWLAEATKFTPDLTTLALHGADRKALFPDIPTTDIVLTTYPLLVRDQDILLAQPFHVAVLDEAQAIKNPKTTAATVAHRLDARHRFALTGTPLENNLGEVWSLFEFLSPGLLGDDTDFRRTFRTPIEKHGDAAAQAFLARRLKPFMLRRTKAEVAKELPPKTEIVERIQFDAAQRDLYETVRALMEKRVRAEIDSKGLAKSHIVFLDALLKLRQICCDPRLLKMEAARKVKHSAKLERLMELVPELVAEGRRILVFSQFTSMLDLIEAELQREKIDFVTLRGDTTDRSEPVRAFQSGSVPVFLLSLKAGGTGLNLTAADTVIHYDPWWNPAAENQATDRAYRIGQDKPVFVHKLIVEGGIEDAIELLKKRKSTLANALFQGTSDAPLKLTEADVSALLAPINMPSTARRR